jgi:hypothetical protein
MIKYYSSIILISVALLLVQCGGESKDEKALSDSLQQKLNINNPALIKLNNRLFSIPSPIQIAMLIKQTKAAYDKDLLNSTSKVSNYTTNFKKALNLGVYGANLGYLNLYDQLPEATRYFAVVKQLGKELGITNTFDKETMRRIENNSSNKDSLVYIISTIYRDADAYLLNNERNDVGILILAGGWVESLFLMTQSIQQNRIPEVVDRIGEQKHPLDNLIELLRPYYDKESEEFNKFLESLVELATVFDGIEIKYNYQKPVVDEQNKTTEINSTTETIISDYQLKHITDLIQKIRKSIVD